MSKNNQILIEELIKQEHESYGQGIALSDFFEFYSASQILKSYELSDDEIENGITGKSLDGGVDSVYLFVNGDLIKGDENIKEKYNKNADIELIIIQSKYENSFNEDVLHKLSRLCKNLFDLDFDRKSFEGRYNDKVLSAFELFKETYLALITKKPQLVVNFYYASKGMHVHENVKKLKEDLITDIKSKLHNAEVELKFIGAEELFKFTQTRTDTVFKLKLSENPLFSTGKVFIALVKLSSYYNFITNGSNVLIKHIFESNVRDYQGKNTVNTEIQDTLVNPDSENFWWLNNGVTILATDASAPGGKELVIHNPEIVNGLQTSSEIYRFFSSLLTALETDNRDVLVRVIVPEDEDSRSRIIRATNSQTAIPKASLRATDEVHRQIEQYMKPKGLYYDRRKNFYKNEGKKSKDIISLPFMSQCLISVLMQKPDFARARPSTLLDDDDSYEKLFHKNNDLITYYLVSLLGRRVELQLKLNNNLEISEVTDIKFYVLYALAAQLTQSIYPNNATISKINYADCDTALIDNSSIFVYDIYKELGGTDKVAKGTSFSVALKDKLRNNFGIS